MRARALYSLAPLAALGLSGALVGADAQADAPAARAPVVPRFSAIGEAPLPPIPAPGQSPPSVDEGAVAWLSIAGVGAPTRKVVTKKTARQAARVTEIYDNNQLTSLDGCLRILSGGRENDLSETYYLASAEAVVPVQREQVIRDEKGGARLLIAQAWVDLRSRQSVAIAQVEAPLTRVLPTQNGLDTWAVREPGGLRLVVSTAPEAVGPRRGMIVPQPCALTSLTIHNDPQGHQGSVDFNRTYLERLSPPEPDLSPMSHALRLTGSLSRLSRDPEPLLSVGLRFTDTEPPPIEPAPATP